MGIFDKIKNALFEVEYVEVEDNPKNEHGKAKETLKAEEPEEKPIAKKIVLPGRREDKVEELKEEDLKDENFEVRPLDETRKEINDFKFMDDADFTVDTEPEMEEEPVPVAVAQPNYVREEIPTEVTAVSPIYAESVPVSEKDYVREYDSYKQRVSNTLNAEYKYKERESRPYGMDPSYNVSIKEYGSYENKDERTYFKPSPIISPIYGVLDKNYKKEDVVSKRDIRITSSYSRSNVNVDDIRDKAYGVKGKIEEEKEPVPTTESPSFDVEEEDENLLVDLSDEKEKPEVKEVTVGDAMDYFNDLGLEYNVDYVDVSSKNPPKKKDDCLEEDIQNTMDMDPVPVPAPVMVESDEVKEPEPEEPKKEVIPKEDNTIEDSDNLFDLIDSMYKEKED